MAAKKQVYNLEFPPWCSELNIFGYRFARVADYAEHLTRLQHLQHFQAEFEIEANSGENAITAEVEIPDTEERAIFSKGTALSDIVVLLSIFTHRHVIAVDSIEDLSMADPRRYVWGGVLSRSLPYKPHPSGEHRPSISINEVYGGMEIGELISWIEELGSAGLEDGINQVYQLIRSDEWQRKYHEGYFLLLANEAFRRQPLSTSFIQCWTLWEHLFSVLNRQWLSQSSIRRLNVLEKIAFLAVEYDLTSEIGQAARKQLEPLVALRNKLVHYGRFPSADSRTDESTWQTAVLFIRLTEVIIAKILGLEPSNVFNTKEKLEALLIKPG